MAVFAFSGYSEKLLFAITKVFDPTYDSTISRLGSIRVNLSIFLDYPLFGIGQAEIGPRFAELLNTRLSAVHNTNTVLFMYASTHNDGISKNGNDNAATNRFF